MFVFSGIVYLNLDHFEEAQVALDKALSLEPTNLSIRQAVDALQKKVAATARNSF